MYTKNNILKEILKENIEKTLLRENVFGAAVPDFVFTQALDLTTNAIKKELMKYVQHSKSNSPLERQETINEINIFISSFREKMKFLFEEELEGFLKTL